MFHEMIVEVHVTTDVEALDEMGRYLFPFSKNVGPLHDQPALSAPVPATDTG